MRRGLSIIGLLVGVVCMFVLYVIMAESLKGPLTGTTKDGGYVANSAPRMQDMMQLRNLMQGLQMKSGSSGQSYPRPSELTDDVSDDTTANLFSLLVAQRYVSPDALISSMDAGLVEPMNDYAWGTWNPSRGEYWDDAFRADLDDVSNVSYAHMVLYGDRLDHWSSRRMDSNFPLLGNRGPRDGVASTDSWACLEDGSWAGQIAYGDGHVDLLMGTSQARRAGPHSEDHYFRIDDEDRHGDAILGFTSDMDEDGPTLQWD